MESFGAFRQGRASRSSSQAWKPPDGWASVLAYVVTAGLLIASINVVATASPRQATTTLPAAASPQSPHVVPAPDTQSVILIDAPGTTGTVNLGGVTAGLDSSDVYSNMFAPGGPELRPDIAVGAEPGSAVDKLATPLVDGLSNGSGDVALQTPRLASIDPIKVDVSANGAVGVRIETADAVSINPDYRALTESRPAQVTGTYACATPGSRLFVNVLDQFASGGGLDYNLVCDGTTRTWSFPVYIASDAPYPIHVTADLSKDDRSLAKAERLVNPPGLVCHQGSCIRRLAR